MKNQLILAISIIIYSINSFGQIPREELIKIKDSLKVEIIRDKKNKLNTDAALKSELIIIDNAIKGKDSIFPFQQFDSVMYTMYNSWKAYELMDWSNSNKMLVKKLNDKQIESLLILISNPLNFAFSSCGEGIIEAKIDFFRNGISIAAIQLSYGHSELYCLPESRLIRFGCMKNSKNIYYDIIKAR